ncbi:extracellular solute-binding protein family 1 [Beutenbergia cavernae DSM 12333]|uniref:Extracellular solute-binding protein family 1 n=1 Tax=Beutenbergia cavernae (strain ATCC BAA-8 / DSM 12333 / CCUG 43141 / JCM 11478 / NBRC 16432 / NCIMB 13614 / HKI 0122) TaxID=471853 RepID=C5C589_BEUC1|nr:ABC transporter substrate-binding protein [Beutenbergia cavernae]ACQ82229.1 extracellular solute-binding protein family 1 [Beutenbergia cavernae DSM 12333]
MSTRVSRRTVLGALAAGGAGAGLLAACGAPNQPQFAASGARILTMWGGWAGDQAGQIQTQLDAFNASQGDYEFRYVPQGAMEQKLLTGIAGGNIPDLVLWDRWQTAKYARRGALQSIDAWAERDGFDLNAFFPESMREMQVEGETFGLPLLVDARSIFYNRAHLDEAGIAPPTTWDELADAAEALTTREGGALKRAGFEIQDVGLFSMYMYQAGGEMLDASFTRTAFDAPEGLDVLSFWDELLHERQVYELGFSDGIDAFAQGIVSIKYDGPWQLPTWDAVEGLEYGIVPAVAGPRGDQGAGLGGFGLIIPTGAPDPEGAWELMKWWAGESANNVAFSEISGWIPANVEAANDPYFVADERFAPLVETISVARIRPPVPGYSDVEGLALIPALQQVMSGTLSGEAALAQAREQGDRILEANR